MPDETLFQVFDNDGFSNHSKVLEKFKAKVRKILCHRHGSVFLFFLSMNY